ncbi:putative Ig domain-containing protein [Jatrophihabitans sp. DSM 45814]
MALPDRPSTGDSGFILLETIFTISIITIIMAAMATFFVSSVTGTNAQRGYQAAVQVTDDAVEFINSLSSSAVVDNRDASSVDAQFTVASSVVQPWLSDMNRAYDSDTPVPAAGTGQNACPSASACAELPTVPVVKTLGNINYNVSYYVGTCVISNGDTTNTCAKTGTLPVVDYARIIVATTWSDSHCPTSTCTYVTAALINSTAEPTFKLNQPPIPPPLVSSPGTQNLTRGGTANLTITATGGATPYAWSASGLPPGLVMDSAGKIAGVATTVGTYTVTATATDSFTNPGSTNFTWNVVAPAVVSSPGNQTGEVGVSESLSISATGGTAPYTWSLANQPDGLSIDGTGKITGKPTTSGTFSNVTVSVTDASKVISNIITFSWPIVDRLALGTVADQTSELSLSDTITIPHSGGRGTLVWTSDTLPGGMTLNQNGTITGVPTVATSTNFNVSVKDAENVTATTSFNWTIYSKLNVAGLIPDQYIAVGAADYTLPTPTSGAGSVVWSTTSTLSGTVHLTSAGHLTGTSATGTFSITMKGTDALGVTSSDTFLWSNLAASTPANKTTTRPGSGTSAPTVTLSATGGSGPYTWAANPAGSLPTWLTLTGNTLTAAITSSTTTKTYTIGLIVTDAGGASRTISFTWKIQ